MEQASIGVAGFYQLQYQPHITTKQLQNISPCEDSQILTQDAVNKTAINSKRTWSKDEVTQKDIISRSTRHLQLQ